MPPAATFVRFNEYYYEQRRIDPAMPVLQRGERMPKRDRCWLLAMGKVLGGI